MKIYLASPYSHEKASVRRNRFDKAALYAGHLIMQGHVVYSPIVHNHTIAELHKLPGDWGFWEKFDRAFIEWCEVVVVLTLEGWEQSKGIKAEKSIAIEEMIPIVHWDPDDRFLDLNAILGGT